jgi:hypothetical protein
VTNIEDEGTYMRNELCADGKMLKEVCVKNWSQGTIDNMIVQVTDVR